MGLSSFIRAINSIVPKNRNYIYCRSTFLYPDNTDAIVAELLKSDKQCTVFCEEPHCSFHDRRVVFVNSRIKSLYYYLRSKYVIWDTGMFGNPRPIKSQTTINLWHGVSFKKIGYYLNPRNNEPPTSTYVVTYSDLFATVMSKAFGVDINNVLTTGEPRNDYLFQPSDDYTLNKLGISTENNKKIVIWMPTYRQHKFEHSNDGQQYDLGFPFITSKQLVDLNMFCKDNNIVFILKWHGLQVLPEHINKDKLSNLVFLTSEALGELSIPLYSVLARCDALITDYSSVFINYMLLDRPMAFAYDDIEYYKINRGFMFDDIEKLMPGVKVKSYDELLRFLKDVASEVDSTKELRESLKFSLNKYYDNQNARRLLETIGVL